MRTLLLLGLLVPLATGCSLGVRGPGRTSYRGGSLSAEPDCTESRVAPALDLVAGATLFVLGAALMTCDEPDYDPATYGQGFDCAGKTVIGVPLMLFGALDAGIGFSGYAKVESCRGARQQHRRDEQVSGAVIGLSPAE